MGVMRRTMLKIVPMLTFTSMLDDPSSGSINTMYLPVRPSPFSPHSTKSSRSSDPMPHTLFPEERMRMNVSSAKTSSFCCCSSWMLVFPDAPRIEVRPARLTCWFTILAATPMSVRSRVS